MNPLAAFQAMLLRAAERLAAPLGRSHHRHDTAAIDDDEAVSEQLDAVADVERDSVDPALAVTPHDAIESRPSSATPVEPHVSSD